MSDFDERPKIDMGGHPKLDPLAVSTPTPLTGHDFARTEHYKSLVREVGDGTKSAGEGISEAFTAGVTAATPKEPS